MDETKREMIMIGKCGLREDTSSLFLKGFSQVLEQIIEKDEWKLGILFWMKVIEYIRIFMRNRCL
jgi:hypothetical protein